MANYTVDNAHSDIGFSVRHMVFAKVRGHFTKWSAQIAFDETDAAKSSLDVSVDASSIDTRESQRDAHLKSADFLDAEKFPKITYKSRKVQRTADKHYRVVGDLTIHGVTHETALDVEELGRGKDPWGNDRILFSAKTSIDRGDFGLKWNQALETGGVLVGEKIDIEVDVETVKSK
jgi:polyisoprenoid-binding protein YceI